MFNDIEDVTSGRLHQAVVDLTDTVYQKDLQVCIADMNIFHLDDAVQLALPAGSLRDTRTSRQ